DPAPNAGAAAPGVDGSISCDFLTQTIYPVSPGPFVALIGGGPGNERLQVYDLRQMKPVGPGIKTNFFGQNFHNKTLSLSPDGAQVAMAPPGRAEPVIDLWEVATGNSLPPLQLNDPGKNHACMVEFLGPDRLITMTLDHPFAEGPADYHVWDFKKRQQISQF